MAKNCEVQFLVHPGCGFRLLNNGLLTIDKLGSASQIRGGKIELNRAKKYYFETAEPKSPSDSTGAAQQANCRELTCSRGCGRTDGPMPTWPLARLADSLGKVTDHHPPIFLEYHLVN